MPGSRSTWRATSRSCARRSSPSRRSPRSQESSRSATPSGSGEEIPKDAKTRLQEIVTRRHGMLPKYRVVGSGPDHAKRFRAEVFVKDEFCGEGEGRSKKEAEQAAAARALEMLDP